VDRPRPHTYPAHLALSPRRPLPPSASVSIAGLPAGVVPEATQGCGDIARCCQSLERLDWPGILFSCNDPGSGAGSCGPDEVYVSGQLQGLRRQLIWECRRQTKGLLSVGVAGASRRRGSRLPASGTILRQMWTRECGPINRNDSGPASQIDAGPQIVLVRTTGFEPADETTRIAPVVAATHTELGFPTLAWCGTIGRRVGQHLKPLRR
jgi:hypothetical protein